MLNLKSISAVMSLLMLLSTVVACTDSGGPNTSGNSDTTSTSSAEETEKITLGLPNTLDYSGETINILVRTESLDYHKAEEMEADVVNNAVYKRNLKVSELLGVDFNFIDMPGFASGAAAFQSAIRKSVDAGDNDYQIVSPAHYYGNVLAVEGYYVDLASTKYINLNQEYWWSDYTDQMTVNGKTYTIMGDFSIDALGLIDVIFFNKSIYDNYKHLEGFDNPYELVKSGKWTLDKMLAMASIAKNDLNADGRYDTEDQLGFIFQLQGMISFPTTCDIRYISKTDDNGYEVTIRSEKSISLYEKLINAIKDSGSGVYYWNDTSSGTGEMLKMFSNSKALFMMHNIDHIRSAQFADVDFGILVSPKYNEEQENYITGTIGGTVFAIPKGHSEEDIDMISAVLEACGYYSYEYTTPAYFETTLKARGTRDEESYEMLNFVRSTLCYDFANIYTHWFPDIIYVYTRCYAGVYSSIPSWWAAQEKVIENSIDEFVKAFE